MDYTKKFPSIVNSLKQIEADNFVLDGEVVAFDEHGRSDFSLLQNVLKTKKGEIYYVIFDLLALNGEDLRGSPLISRKEKLERLIFKAGLPIMYSKHFSDGKASFEFAKTHNLEGVVAKRKSSKYLGVRDEDWLKIKCYLRQEFVIAGYTTTSKNELISALVLGYYDKGELVYIGRVGTGLSESDKSELHKKFQKLVRASCPFKDTPKIDKVIWLSPKLVAEIQYAELTKDKLLRQPSFIGLRKDKEAKEVKLETK